MPRENGYLIFRGPSQLDKTPILVISTGFSRESKNPKTGPMVQVFIMPELVDPSRAAVNGADKSVCGDCKLRTKVVDGVRKRACYVTPFQAPLAVWKAWKRGNYPAVGSLKEITELHRNKSVRLGAWGDPVAAPVQVMAAAVSDAANYTGYTHQWKHCPEEFRSLIMASVDTPEEYHEAKALGWRTFRTRIDSQPLMRTEITCPAAPEAGHRTTCNRCSLCNGSRPFARNGQSINDFRKDVAILAHGQGKGLFDGQFFRVL